MSPFTFAGSTVPFLEGDSVLLARLRGGETVAGALCFSGDCPHCLATVDGVSYVRTCETPCREGMVVEPHPPDSAPPLSTGTTAETAPVRISHCDLVVIGQGESGNLAATEAIAAGRRVITLDSNQGTDAIGIYAGLTVLARSERGLRRIHCDDVVVATGAAEIQPVCPGSSLGGIYTSRAAERLMDHGVDLGTIVAVGDPPAGHTPVSGHLVRFEGERRVAAVVTRDADGIEHTHPCDTAVVGLGLHPRDALFRMGRDLGVSVVGDAALDHPVPPPPAAGTVCPCADVTVDDVKAVWARGFHEMELMKRATLAGTGTCQGMACLPHLRSLLADLGGTVQPPFTARPVTKQVTFGEIAAGAHLRAYPRTALDGEHRHLGAEMDRIGGWWRPWTYGDTEGEYWAVRNGVSIGDVSTLGKMIVSGPDSTELLERLYPTRIAGIKPGRSKYVLLLDERGYVLDDGLVCRDGEDDWFLTFTSSGATFAEMWVRDWAESWELDVRILSRTMSLGAINVTGPRAKALLERVGLDDAPRYMGHTRAQIAGIECRVFRLSFTGEQSFELHHATADSVELWRALLDAGSDLEVRPHGIDALLKLRLEKGHILVGQDSDFDSTPRRLHHDWAVDLSKEFFVGKAATVRTNKAPLNKQLVGFTMNGPAPHEGAVIWTNGEYNGYVTSATWSPVTEQSVLLGWLYLRDGELPTEATIEDRRALVSSVPFYDPEGGRARA